MSGHLLSVSEERLAELAQIHGRVRACLNCNGVMLPGTMDFTDKRVGHIEIRNFPIMKCQSEETCGAVHESAKEIISHVKNARQLLVKSGACYLEYDCNNQSID